jgi:hypothetical protein
MIETKDVLNWCFTVAALVFGVFGFLYSAYASASFAAAQAGTARPPVVYDLRRFCRLLASILVVLTGLAAFASASAGAPSGVGPQTWIIVGCYGVLSVVSAVWAFFFME